MADVSIAVLLPSTAAGHLFSLYPLPPRFLGYLAVLLTAFVAATEPVKCSFTGITGRNGYMFRERDGAANRRGRV